MSENVVVKRRGRPSKLPRVVDELVELLAGGTSISEASRTVGIDRRSVQLWCSRARAADPSDARYELERRVLAARR